mmetsp:Transcript_24808/g.28506  ORF Transcript_24808/g.28506 Transcript_24808/m.28506 type:complete len:119 (-) Transcript_24808:622-978(-)
MKRSQFMTLNFERNYQKPHRGLFTGAFGQSSHSLRERSQAQIIKETFEAEPSQRCGNTKDGTKGELKFYKSRLVKGKDFKRFAILPARGAKCRFVVKYNKIKAQLRRRRAEHDFELVK